MATKHFPSVALVKGGVFGFLDLWLYLVGAAEVRKKGIQLKWANHSNIGDRLEME